MHLSNKIHQIVTRQIFLTLTLVFVSCGTIPIPVHLSTSENSKVSIANNAVENSISVDKEANNKDMTAIKNSQSITKTSPPQAVIANVTPEQNAIETKKKIHEEKFILAKAKLNVGEYVNAARILEKLTGDDIDNLKGNLKDNKKHRKLLVQTYTRYASYLLNKTQAASAQQVSEAKSMLKKALRLQPHNRALKTRLKELENGYQADQYYLAGVDALKENNQDLAIDAFSQALILKPDHTSAKNEILLLKRKFSMPYHKKVMILYRKQKLDEAIGLWDKLLVLDPSHSLANVYRARALKLKENIGKL